jgi:hypothetical protein
MKKKLVLIGSSLMAVVLLGAGTAVAVTGTVGKPVTSKPYKVVVTKVTPGEASTDGTPTVIVSFTVTNVAKKSAKVPVVEYQCGGKSQSDVVGGGDASPIFSGSIEPKGTFNATRRWANPTGCVNPTVTVAAPVTIKGKPKPISIKITGVQ